MEKQEKAICISGARYWSRSEQYYEIYEERENKK